MTKLKSSEYWEEMWEDNDMITLQEVIKKAQQNAIEAALEVAASEGKVEQCWNEMGEVINKFRIDKKSITSLINHKDLKV